MNCGISVIFKDTKITTANEFLEEIEKKAFQKVIRPKLACLLSNLVSQKHKGK